MCLGHSRSRLGKDSESEPVQNSFTKALDNKLFLMLHIVTLQ